ncbi:MAG: hypothetical protein OIN87_09180 [Candidatus Methanoperedens sp.]|nr:hypothetical protein [Candidatus Methanoperedens sp.]
MVRNGLRSEKVNISICLKAITLKVKYLVNQVKIMTTIEKIQKYDYSDILIWISVLLLVFYVIAKIIGIN